MIKDVKVNPHFIDYVFDWDHKFYFLVGGYGSSKSYNTALKLVLKALEEKRKILVVRQVYATMADSVFALFQDVVSMLGVGSVVNFIKSPYSIKFANGSEIILRGLDDPEKLKSIHDISIIWIEECSEIRYDGFKELIGRARHPYLSRHFILTSNPTSKSNWSYQHFFIDTSDIQRPRLILDDERLYKEKIIKNHNETYYHHSTAKDNYFLPSDYMEDLEKTKEYDPDMYRVAAQGRYGANGVKVLPQAEVMEHERVISKIGNIPARFYRVGMDFGFEESYNAVIRCAIDDDNKYLYVWWEYYKNKMTDDKTAKNPDFKTLKEYGELIRADSADPKAIKFYQQEGYKIIGAKKGPGSRLANVKKMKRFRKIFISDRCPNAVREFTELTYKQDKNGEIIPDEFNFDPHTFEATWYALDGYEVADIKNRKNYSGKGRR